MMHLIFFKDWSLGWRYKEYPTESADGALQNEGTLCMQLY